MPAPVDLSKLSDLVKNDVVKKDKYNKLIAKINNIDTSGFVLKAKYDTDKSEIENQIPDTIGLVKKTNYNTKITELENKIPDISNLATKTALTAMKIKYLVLVIWLKKQTVILKLQKLKINLIIIIMINILILQSLIN